MATHDDPTAILSKRLVQLLASNRTLKIATSGGPVSPWVATAYFAESGPFELHVMIESGGKTLANVKAHPRVAVMLENGDAFGLFGQAQGRAALVEAGAAERFQAEVVAKTPESAPLMRLPNLVPVRIEIDRWLLTDVGSGWLPAKELRAPGGKGLRAA